MKTLIRFHGHFKNGSIKNKLLYYTLMYICIERGRERERERGPGDRDTSSL
jgi:hypothetical protein